MDRAEITSVAAEAPCSILRLRIGHVELGVPAELVEEVLEPSDVTPIPCAPRHVPGLVAVRGEAVPVFDIAVFLGLSEASAEAARMLIVRSPPYRVGLPCDQVLGVAALPRSAIQDVRVSGPPQMRRYLLGEVELRGAVAPVLDVPALLVAGRAR